MSAEAVAEGAYTNIVELLRFYWNNSADVPSARWPNSGAQFKPALLAGSFTFDGTADEEAIVAGFENLRRCFQVDRILPLSPAGVELRSSRPSDTELNQGTIYIERGGDRPAQLTLENGVGVPVSESAPQINVAQLRFADDASSRAMQGSMVATIGLNAPRYDLLVSQQPDGSYVINEDGIAACGGAAFPVRSVWNSGSSPSSGGN